MHPCFNHTLLVDAPTNSPGSTSSGNHSSTTGQIQTQTPTTSFTLINCPLKTLPPFCILPIPNPRIHPGAMRRLARIRNQPTRMNLRLKRHRMNPIRMETFSDRLGETVKVNNDITVENHMRRG